MGAHAVHAAVFKDADSDQWVAVCLEFDVVTHGRSEQDAQKMIREAVELYLEYQTPSEIEMLYQRIEGEPRIHRVEISAPSLLNQRG